MIVERRRKHFTAVHEPLVVVDENGRIASANPAFLALFQLDASDALQTSLFQVGGGVFAGSEMSARIGVLMAEGTPFRSVALDHGTSEGRRFLLVNGRCLLGPFAAPRHFLLALNERSAK